MCRDAVEKGCCTWDATADASVSGEMWWESGWCMGPRWIHSRFHCPPMMLSVSGFKKTKQNKKNQTQDLIKWRERENMHQIQAVLQNKCLTKTTVCKMFYHLKTMRYWVSLYAFKMHISYEKKLMKKFKCKENVWMFSGLSIHLNDYNTNCWISWSTLDKLQFSLSKNPFLQRKSVWIVEACTLLEKKQNKI